MKRGLIAASLKPKKTKNAVVNKAVLRKAAREAARKEVRTIRSSEPEEKMELRAAARARRPLDGTDAQALEGALSQVERELASAKAENTVKDKALRELIEMERLEELTDPDKGMTDMGRESVWANAKAAILTEPDLGFRMEDIAAALATLVDGQIVEAIDALRDALRAYGLEPPVGDLTRTQALEGALSQVERELAVSKALVNELREMLGVSNVKVNVTSQNEKIVLAVAELLREHYFRPGQNHPDATEIVDEITDTLRKSGYIDWTVNQSNQHMEDVLGL